MAIGRLSGLPWLPPLIDMCIDDLAQGQPLPATRNTCSHSACCNWLEELQQRLTSRITVIVKRLHRDSSLTCPAPADSNPSVRIPLRRTFQVQDCAVRCEETSRQSGAADRPPGIHLFSPVCRNQPRQGNDMFQALLAQSLN